MIGVGISTWRAGVLGGDSGVALGVGGTTLTALQQILALDPVALWWPTEGSGWQGRTGGTLSAVGSPVGILPDLSELGGATLDEWLANPTTPELVTNGGFDTDSDWTKATGVTISGGVANFANVNTSSALYQASAVSSGKWYAVTATVNRSSGTLVLRCFGASSGLSIVESGTFTAIQYVNTTNTNIGCAASSFTGTIDNISIRELPGIHAIAPTDAARPLLAADPSRLTWDKVDDVLNATMPATTGKMVLSTPEGTAVYGVNISAGSYDVGGRNGDFFPGTSLVGQTVGDFTDEEAASIATIFRAAGGGDDYGGVTDFTGFWRGWSELTSFPVIDTSSGTNFQAAWRDCTSLTTFPALDVSSGTSFEGAWLNCTNLAAFPANMFDNLTATNFTNAFANTNLTQTSIDNILTSINTAGTSNGTFTQSGGSAPSATGEAAIDALVSRGWTVTVTGGYVARTILDRSGAAIFDRANNFITERAA